MISIAIAEDQALFRKGMIAMLNSVEDFEVVIEAENGQILLEQIKRSNVFPNLIVLDLRMPEMDGLKATELLKSDYPESNIIIISAHDDEDIIAHLYELGANAFLDKNAEPEEVEYGIRSVLKNGVYLNNAAKQALDEISKMQKKSAITFKEDLLTNRELEVIKLICKEYSTQQIAEMLAISKKAVEYHRSSLLKKTYSSNVAGLVLYAIKQKIVNIADLKINQF